jgi:hypothetical protein
MEDQGMNVKKISLLSEAISVSIIAAPVCGAA